MIKQMPYAHRSFVCVSAESGQHEHEQHSVDDHKADDAEQVSVRLLDVARPVNRVPRDFDLSRIVRVSYFEVEILLSAAPALWLGNGDDVR